MEDLTLQRDRLVSESKIAPIPATEAVKDLLDHFRSNAAKDPFNRQYDGANRWLAKPNNKGCVLA